MAVGSDTWIALTLTAALLDWIAVGLRWTPLEYLAKPATLALLVGYAHALRQDATNPHLARWLEVGLVLSLGGDIALIFEGHTWFLAGLVSFLLAHVAYTIAFTGAGRLPSRRGLLPITLSVPAITVPLMARLARALHSRGQKTLVPAILVYGTAISVMWISALAASLYSNWTAPARTLAALGASLFCFSDAVLAWNRFVAPVPAGRLLVIIPYHLAQVALATTIAWAPAQPQAHKHRR